MAKINIRLFDLEFNKMSKGIDKEYWIEFHEKHLFVFMECCIDIYPKPDDDFTQVKKEEYRKQTELILKSSCIRIETCFTENQNWRIDLLFIDAKNTYWIFDNEPEMRVVEKKLQEWLLS